LSETTAKKLDPAGPHNTKRACTILLLPKKIKFFYSLPHKHLAISVNRKIPDFRTKRASLCKGWGDNFFLVVEKKCHSREGGNPEKKKKTEQIQKGAGKTMKDKTKNEDRFGAEFRASTRRLPAAARSRIVIHRGRADRQEQRRNHPKEPPKTEGTCANCRHSEVLTGPDGPMLICEQRTDTRAKFHVVDPAASCPDFDNCGHTPAEITEA
jgi:hypothetical protein